MNNIETLDEEFDSLLAKHNKTIAKKAGCNDRELIELITAAGIKGDSSTFAKDWHESLYNENKSTLEFYIENGWQPPTSTDFLEMGIRRLKASLKETVKHRCNFKATRRG